MDFEQLVKRLEWLEGERRKDKTIIATLEERMVSYEGTIDRLTRQIKDVEKRISELSSTTARINQFDENLANYRAEVSKLFDDSEKRTQRRDRERAKQHREELEPITAAITELRQSLEQFDELRKSLHTRAEEDIRLSREIAELSRSLTEKTEPIDDIQRVQRVHDENRRLDVKRVADLQGEIAAVRKRIDDHREKTDLTADTLRQLDSRITELMASESERRQAQLTFIEAQNRAHLEREKAFKEWSTRYGDFIKQTANLDAQLQALDSTHRAVKRAQETHEELNQRLERRINEITEIQRLAEDRMRQEWVTFKADDQKRWTSYSLSADEHTKDLRENIKRLGEQITDLRDLIQTQQDQLQQTTEVTEQQLQELMNWAHEWLTGYEQIMGRSRKPVK